MKISIWSLTYPHCVFKWYHSDKHFSEFYVQDRRENQLSLYILFNQQHRSMNNALTLTVEYLDLVCA